MELEKRKAPIEVEEEQEGNMSTMTGLSLQANEATFSEANDSSDQPLNRDEVLHSKRLYWIGRRTQDIIFSSIAILVLWPLVLICAILIVIDSPGASPFFVQERVGRDGKKFKFLNLRCMENMRRMNEVSGRIRAYICAIQTANFSIAHFRHQNESFSAVEVG